MIDKIEIENSIFNSNVLVIYPNELYFTINEIKKNITNEKIDSLLNIIRTWDNNYVDSSIIDGEECRINIYINDVVDKYIIKNKYPENYYLLRDWLGEINDR